jgi:hypothetical protein
LYEELDMTGEQLRAARALLKIGTRELAALAGVDKMSIVGCENGRRTQAATVAKIRYALETAGIIFLDGRKGEYQATAALRWGVQEPKFGTPNNDTIGKSNDGGLHSRAWDEDFEDTVDPAEMSDSERAWLKYVRTNPNLSVRGREILLKTVRPHGVNSHRIT